ncbi:D-tyrosyl-tRNA(Tyr) deacylase [Pleurocapsales cyanobacterium LEGE 10410]|nr:D-tyrosyl-tRNA(Tyr) deacylase [Pleurocapsales cyanobacterium LEGE 10410]
MRIILQRVKSSSVSIDGEIISQIGRGLNLLVGISATDTEAELDWMTRKCLELRLFRDETTDKPWSKSIVDIQGEILVVSQFTLYGDCRKGRRPSFSGSATPNLAEPLYDRFVTKLQQSGLAIASGKFGAMMDVKIENDGPVTLILEK